MSVEMIERDFKQKVCDKVRLASEGLNRYRVFTPFMFEDGDHLAIVLKREGGHWLLSDEGHTYMHLTYEIDERDWQKGTRATIITNSLAAFSVDDRNGELVLSVSDGKYGDALFSFVQALLKITDLTFVSRERVRSTFMEDFRSFLTQRVPETRRVFDWNDPEHDPEDKYAVDCKVNGLQRPLLIYALLGDDRVRDATICLHQFERWGVPYRSLGIYENMEEINRKVAARFTDICEKQFSSLAANREVISRFIEGVLREG